MPDGRPDAPTIGQRLEDLDAARFAGRELELAQLEAWLRAEPAVNVVLVHGPGGIGKSALLRELSRRARGRGWATALVEGRDLPPTPEGIHASLADLEPAEHALVVFDSWERAWGLTDFLRDHVIPTLPIGWVAVIASRNEPDERWTRGGWEYLGRELRLGPLVDSDARECARRLGVDEANAARTMAWAAGSPLALVLGARVGDAWGEAGAPPAELVDPLVRRLVDVELDDRDLAVIAAASIARVTTPALLRAAIPGIDADDAYQWLATRSFAEALGDGVALHALVARAVRAQVERRHGDLARELRRLIADYAFTEATRAGRAPSFDLAWLIDDPALRWGFGWDQSGELRLDRLRPGDLESIEAWMAPGPGDQWWASTRRYLLESPADVIIARTSSDAPAGFAVIASSRDRSPLGDDPLVVPWLDDARERARDGDAVLWLRSTRTSDEQGVNAVLGFGGLLTSGLANPRYLYLPIDRTNADAMAFSASLGAEHVPELDVDLGAMVIECHIVDLGWGGLLAAQRDAVYREIGISEPSPSRAFAVERLDADAVRGLLRDASRPERLARSPFAVGSTTVDRAASVRGLLDAAVDRTFGAGTRDERLRAVLSAGYLERTNTHEVVAASMHVSRAVYFRLAREAIDRLTVTLRVLLLES